MINKWVGAGLGWVFLGGPLGAIIGYMGVKYLSKKGVSNDFDISLLVLSSAVIQADGIVREEEKSFVKNYFIKVFGFNKATRYLDVLYKLNNQKINNIPDVCRQIRNNVNKAGLLEIVHFLFGIAASDREIHNSESQVILQISHNLGLNEYEFNSIKSMFINTKDSSKCYNILGISPDDSEDKIKKAYRELVKKYHPDKLVNVSDEIRNLAKDKFKAVHDAYQTIRKEKNF